MIELTFIMGLFVGISLSSLFAGIGWTICERAYQKKGITIPKFLKRR